MKRKSIIAVIVVAVLGVAGLFIYRDAIAKPAESFRFVAVERGNLQQTVSATGTLGAVTTISVGTQVSGQVSSLLVDYNDHVTKGELLARIDPTLAQQTVVDAQANLDKMRAVLLQGQRDNNRNRELNGDGLLAKSAFEQSQSSVDVANADVKSAQVALDRTWPTPASLPRSTAWSSTATCSKGRPSPPAFQRRSSSSSPTIWRTCRSWRR
ncbi:MAG TPA: biotin/lipoyl-binding protein [Thermoanaerobaculia bacterium]|jgi:HlyD family secretion protein|nr:biotin/lipoyl-binding protein [Thermoanaerobaculia bacterium]